MILESHGIAEFNNRAYHDSLYQAAKEVRDTIRTIIKNGDTDDQYDVIVIQYANGVETNEFYTKQINVKIDGVSWIEDVRILVTTNNATDACLLGDTETLADVSQNLYKPVELRERKRFGWKKSIPFKYKNGKITECHILLYLNGRETLDDLETMIDHELGHGKDVLDWQTSIAKMNSDVIDSKALEEIFRNYNTNHIWILANDKIPFENRLNFLNTSVSSGDICKWFVEIMYDVNASEIRQHRKNFYNQIKNFVIGWEPTESDIEFMRKHSLEFDDYYRILEILKFLKEHMSSEQKKQFYSQYIDKYINRERSSKHRLYVYGRQFLGYNKQGGATAVNEFLNYLIKNIDEYYITRCRRVFKAIYNQMKGYLKEDFMPRLYEHHPAKYQMIREQNLDIIRMAKEELLTD